MSGSPRSSSVARLPLMTQLAADKRRPGQGPGAAGACDGQAIPPPCPGEAVEFVRMEAGRGRVAGRPGAVATGCPVAPMKEGFAAPAPALPRLRCRAGLFERHEQQAASEFLGAEAVGAGGDDEFAKLGLLTCLEVPWPRPLSRWLGRTPGPSSMVISPSRSGSCASCTVALEPYLIALSTRLLIARRRAAIGRQLIATPRALE